MSLLSILGGVSREHFDTTINSLRNQIIMSTADTVKQLNDITTQVQKIGAESTATLQKVTDLQAVIDAGAGVPPEVQAAVDALAAQVKVVDDLVPDAPAV